MGGEVRRWHGGVIDLDNRWYTASDGTPDFVYREVVKRRGKWWLKFRGKKRTA